MFEIKVTLHTPELATAILALAGSLELNAKGPNAAATPVSASPEVFSATQQLVSPAPAGFPNPAPVIDPLLAPTPLAPPMQPQAPAPQTFGQPPAQAPAAVPTTAPTYTMDQLAVAATQLMDAGRRQDLLNLLAAFGVPSLTALPKEQYGNFATQLRTMGAKI